MNNTIAFRRFGVCDDISAFHALIGFCDRNGLFLKIKIQVSAQAVHPLEFQSNRAFQRHRRNEACPSSPRSSRRTSCCCLAFFRQFMYNIFTIYRLMVKMMQDADLEHITVHTRAMNLSLQQLKNSVDANDIITDPDYQRKYVYDDKRASCLIESILIGIPIPVIYLAEEEDGVYSVIDGQQRITSFVRYLKNEFPLVGLKRLQSLNGLYFKQLDKAVQRRLNYQTLSTVCIEKIPKI